MPADACNRTMDLRTVHTLVAKDTFMTMYNRNKCTISIIIEMEETSQKTGLFFSYLKSPSGPRLPYEVLRSYSDTPHSVDVLRMSDRPVAETCT